LRYDGGLEALAVLLGGGSIEVLGEEGEREGEGELSCD